MAIRLRAELLLGGKYFLERELRSGGHGEIWIARDVAFEAPSAVSTDRRHGRLIIKTASPTEGNDQSVVVANRRLARESATMARLMMLRHPGFVPLLDSGYDPIPWIAMPLYEGNLADFVRDRIADHKPITVGDALELGQAIVAALAVAHQAGIPHRDMKPENIFYESDSYANRLGIRPVIGDFGLARPDSAPRVTIENLVVGTPHYMAPERFEGAEGDAASDVYALGVMLFELIAGKVPFDHHHTAALQHLHAQAKPDVAALIAGGASPEVVKLLRDRLLRKDPSERPTARWTADELKRILDLGAVQREQDIESRSPPTREGITPKRRRTRRPWPALVGLVAVGLVFVALAWRHDPLGGTGSLIDAAAVKQPAQAPSRTPSKAPPLPDCRAGMAHIPRTVFQMGRAAAALLHECAGLVQCFAEKIERAEKVRTITISEFDVDRMEMSNEQAVEILNRVSELLDPRGELHPDKDAPPVRFLYEAKPHGKRLMDFDKRGDIYRDAQGKYRIRNHAEKKPVGGATWYGAKFLCEQEGKRLITEAEWELLASGTEGRRYPWGNQAPTCSTVVFDREKDDDDPKREIECRPKNANESLGTEAVDQPKADRTPDYDIFDLGGNSAEWVADGFLSEYPDCPSPCVDPKVEQGEKDGDRELKVFRGGGASYQRQSLFSFERSRLDGEISRDNITVRCAASHPKPVNRRGEDEHTR